MRIDPNVVVLPITDTKAGESKPRKAEQGAAVVSLSAHAVAVAQERDEVDLDSRVERIKALVQRGAYPIDLDMLASRIVDDDILRSGK